MEVLVNNYIFVSAIIVLLSVLLSKSSDRFGLPVLLVFLGIGILAGSEGIGGIDFENYELTQFLGTFALCLIIFTGGVETNLEEIMPNLKRGITLSSLGIVVTTALVGFFVNFITDLTLVESMLLGAILSATDAAASFSIFKDKNSQVVPRTKNLLKFESGSNDPMAYFLVIFLLGYMQGENSGALGITLSLILNPAIGLFFGWFFSQLFIALNNRINLSHVGLYPALTLSFLFLSYSSSIYLEGNGFLAVYVFGIIISSKKLLHKSLLYSFYDGISWLSQIGLFVMLGLLVFPSRLIQIAPIGLMVAVFLIFFARPVTIMLCLLKSRFNLKEKTFIAWAGLKGATPIVFASLAAVKLGTKAHMIFDIVFFVVLVSAILQGLTMKLMARKLGLLYESVEDPNFPIDLDVLEKTKNGIRDLSIGSRDFAVGRRIVDLFLPQGCLVLFIKRNGAFIIPDGATEFKSGDKVLIATRERSDIEEAVDCFKIGVAKEGIFFKGAYSEQIH
ncbi:potassium/proton antiporter [Bacteriovorax sp. DB6_IX]|uniref:potassium/proton antiporter n=1 Tax=Bacteriovorax sp. DB6_IX TaxID=1353530 RepID=UPI000389FA0F|nr:potassium/proton antiporter [Bacteriovorax sp. DB6_IX]EQC43155.1 transporter, CPA2 family [Bacteriovorax sp. DB6_IX]